MKLDRHARRLATRAASGFILSGLLLTGSGLLRAQDSSATVRQSDFTFFVQQFEANYAYIDRVEKPWLTWERRYRDAVAAASSKEAFAEVLASALSEVHDFHAEVRSRVPDRWLPSPSFTDVWAEFQGARAVVVAVRRGSDAERAQVRVGDRVVKINGVALEEAIGQRLTPAVDRAEAKARKWALLSILTGRSEEARTLLLQRKDGQMRTVTLPVEREFRHGPGLLTVTTLPGGIGLIRFNNSLGDQKTVEAFDQALQQLRSTQGSGKGLILDLRDVPSGGDSSVALGILGRLVQTMLPYQRHRIAHFGQPDVERNWIEQVAPRGPFCYTGPVAVLVDHWTGSMGEGMAIGLDGMHRAVVVGGRMAGLAGAVTDFRLPGTGIDVAFATEQLFHVNGTPRQDWLPEVRVPAADSDENDLVLQRGLEELARMRR